MSFQAYIDNIIKLTNQKPDQIKANAIKQGIIVPDLKATAWVVWLKKEYGLGHGHSMALWKYFVEMGWIKPAKTKLKP